MKFYSEETQKLYASEAECAKAEQEHKAMVEALAEERKKAELAKKEKDLTVAKEKKELANAVEAADKCLADAYTEYENKEAEVKELYKAYQTKADELLNPAKEAIKNAQKAKYEAIAAYNKKFGLYSVNYTGPKAYEEFKRTSNFIDRMFKDFWF